MKQIEEQMNKFIAQKRHDEQIWCPHCNHNQDTETIYHHVTYWGDEERKLCSCESCGKTFWVEENVERTFKSFKEDE